MSILKTHRVALAITALVATVLIFRTSDSSPGRFLMQTVRELQQNYTVDKICGSVNPNKPFTQDEINRAKDYQDSISSIRGGNPLKEFIEAGKSHDRLGQDYFKDLAPIAAGWAVGFVISLIGFISCTICCCCNVCNCCKVNGESRASCCNKRKYQTNSTKKFNILAIVAMVLGAGILASSILGVVSGSNFEEGSDRILCNLASLLDDALKGNTATQWLGITPSIQNLNTISTNINNVAGSLSTVDTNTATLNSRFTATETSINNLYTFGNGKTVARADTRETTPYEPEYISNLGPSNQQGKYTNVILTEVQYKHQTVTSSLTDMDSSVSTLKTDTQNIKSALESGQGEAQTLENSATTFLNDLGDLQDNNVSLSQIIQISIQASFIPTVLFSFTGLLSIVLIWIFKIKSLNFLLHTSWIGLAFFNIITWILTMVLFPGSVILSEVCDITDEFLNDNTFFNNTLNALDIGDKKFNDFSYECLHNTNGDIAKFLGITSQMNTFDNMFNSLSNTEQFWNVDTSTASKSISIPHQQNILSVTKNGISIDSVNTINDLYSLNNLTNSQQTPCALNLFDKWVLNSANCSNTNKVFQQTDAANAHLGDSVCIGFNDWRAASLNPSNRYSSTQYGSCGTISGQSYDQFVVGFVNQFSTNRQQVETLYGNLETELGKVETANSLYMDEVYAKTSVFKTIDTQVADIKQSLTGSSGFLNNMQCSWVKEKTQHVFDSICVGWMVDVYKVAIVMAVVSCFTLVGSLTMYLLATQIGSKKDDERNDGQRVLPMTRKYDAGN